MAVYQTIYKIPVGIGDAIEILSLPDMAAYEWRIHYAATDTTDTTCINYGSPEAALRDALIIYLG